MIYVKFNDFLKENLLFEGKVKKSDKVDILRDGEYVVVRPLTHQASCKYGAFTQWCYKLVTVLIVNNSIFI